MTPEEMARKLMDAKCNVYMHDFGDWQYYKVSVVNEVIAALLAQAKEVPQA